MSIVASRYARAFAEVVTERKIDPDKAVAELAEIAGLVRSTPELRNVLQNPSVAPAQKLNLLDAIMKRSGGSRQLRNFLAVLVDQHRIGDIAEITDEFKRELDRRVGIAQAHVSSARELTAAEKSALEKQMTVVTGRKVRATYALDPGLLGGAVVRIGSTIYDGSVLRKLRNLKEQIATP